MTRCWCCPCCPRCPNASPAAWGRGRGSRGCPAPPRAAGTLPGHSSRQTGQQLPGSRTFTAPCRDGALIPRPHVPPAHGTPARTRPLPTCAPLHECPLQVIPSFPPKAPPTPSPPHLGAAEGGAAGGAGSLPVDAAARLALLLPLAASLPDRETRLSPAAVQRDTPQHKGRPLAPLTWCSCPRCQHSQSAAGTQWPALLR